MQKAVYTSDDSWTQNEIDRAQLESEDKQLAVTVQRQATERDRFFPADM